MSQLRWEKNNYDEKNSTKMRKTQLSSEKHNYDEKCTTKMRKTRLSSPHFIDEYVQSTLLLPVDEQLLHWLGLPALYNVQTTSVFTT